MTILIEFNKEYNTNKEKVKVLGTYDSITDAYIHMENMLINKMGIQKPIDWNDVKGFERQIDFDITNKDAFLDDTYMCYYKWQLLQV